MGTIGFKRSRAYLRNDLNGKKVCSFRCSIVNYNSSHIVKILYSLIFSGYQLYQTYTHVYTVFENNELTS